MTKDEYIARYSTPEDVELFFGNIDFTGMTLDRNGFPVGIAGITIIDGIQVAISDMRESIPPKIIYVNAMLFAEFLDKQDGNIYAMNSEYPSGLLRRMGFRFLEKQEEGDVFIWSK